MTEQRLREFTERAEAQVVVPDFGEIASRGLDLRRSRMQGAGAAVAAVALVVGVVAWQVAGAERSAPDPAGPPSAPTPSALGPGELPPRTDADQRLVAGGKYRVSPYDEGALGPPVTVSFTVPAEGWIWADDAVVKSGAGGSGTVDADDSRTRVGIMVVDRVATSQCRSQYVDWTSIGSDALTAATLIGEVPRVEVVEPARPTQRFGHPAAHVRLTVPRVCAAWNDALLWSLSPAELGGQPGVGTVRHSGQVLDVWVVDVDDTIVVVHAEHAPGLPRELGEEAQAIVDSMSIERAADG